MKIAKIGIQSVINYDDFSLDFRGGNNGLHIIYGPNEAGKSTLLQVIIDLLFGGKLEPFNKNYYSSTSRIYGILKDEQDKTYPIKRKKSRTRLVLDKDTSPN